MRLGIDTRFHAAAVLVAAAGFILTACGSGAADGGQIESEDGDIRRFCPQPADPCTVARRQGQRCFVDPAVDGTPCPGGACRDGACLTIVPADAGSVVSGAPDAGPRTAPDAGVMQPGYHASPGGSGTSCTLASPCSLTTGLQKLTAGDTLYLRGGTYHQAVSVSASGTETARITVAGYPGETAVIDGADTLPSVEWGVLVGVSGGYVTIRDLEIRRSLWMGVKLSGVRDEAINVSSHDHWENGILVTGDYGLVEGCRVYNNARSNANCSRTRSSWASGLSAARAPTGATLRGNRVWHNWGEGVSAYEAYGTTIEDNVSYDNYSVNLYISDAVGTLAQRNLVYVTGAIACGGAQLGIAISSEGQPPNNSDTRLINNVVVNANRNFYFYSADADGMVNTLIAHNTFVNSRSTANFLIGDGKVHVNAAIRNNLFLQEDSVPIAIVSGTGLTFSNNLWSKAPAAGAVSSTDIVADPQLAKAGSAAQPTGDYFRLLPGSPAVDRAVALPEVVEDFFRSRRGASRDIGAHEL